MSRFPGLVGGVYHLASRAVLNYQFRIDAGHPVVNK